MFSSSGSCKAANARRRATSLCKTQKKRVDGGRSTLEPCSRPSTRSCCFAFFFYSFFIFISVLHPCEFACSNRTNEWEWHEMHEGASASYDGRWLNTMATWWATWRTHSVSIWGFGRGAVSDSDYIFCHNFHSHSPRSWNNTISSGDAGKCATLKFRLLEICSFSVCPAPDSSSTTACLRMREMRETKRVRAAKLLVVYNSTSMKFIFLQRCLFFMFVCVSSISASADMRLDRLPFRNVTSDHCSYWRPEENVLLFWVKINSRSNSQAKRKRTDTKTDKISYIDIRCSPWNWGVETSLDISSLLFLTPSPWYITN